MPWSSWRRTAIRRAAPVPCRTLDALGRQAAGALGFRAAAPQALVFESVAPAQLLAEGDAAAAAAARADLCACIGAAAMAVGMSTRATDLARAACERAHRVRQAADEAAGRRQQARHERPNHGCRPPPGLPRCAPRRRRPGRHGGGAHGQDQRDRRRGRARPTKPSRSTAATATRSSTTSNATTGTRRPSTCSTAASTRCTGSWPPASSPARAGCPTVQVVDRPRRPTTTGRGVGPQTDNGNTERSGTLETARTGHGVDNIDRCFLQVGFCRHRDPS